MVRIRIIAKGIANEPVEMTDEEFGRFLENCPKVKWEYVD